jgi:hypothetical protein
LYNDDRGIVGQVTRAFQEFFEGYHADRSFSDVFRHRFLLLRAAQPMIVVAARKTSKSCRSRLELQRKTAIGY